MTSRVLLASTSLLLSPVINAHGPLPISLKGVPIPPVPGLFDGEDPIVMDKNIAIALGKALFWDMNVGSDGMACASCHFHAGADSRVKNQLNPGFKSTQATGQSFERTASGAVGGPNYTLTKRDFPFHQFKDASDKDSGVIFESDDVVSSAGTFKADYINTVQSGSLVDECARGADAVFHVGAINTRQVEPRNTPTVINSVFNFRNFWDGRANNIFNGVNNWGDRDPNAGVWVMTAENKLVKQRLQLKNSSLASLSVAPPLNDLEMSCNNRTFKALAKKLLSRQPLENQRVHPNDSVFGPLKLTNQSQIGLNTTYKGMIKKAFNQKYWAFGGDYSTYPFLIKPVFMQMESNFSLFFGLALQLYMGTLISDDAPFDRAAVDKSLRPIGLSAEAQIGFALFEDFHCNICHAGPTLTAAAIAINAQLVETNPAALGLSNAAKGGGISRNIINHDAMLNGINRFMDFGFFNTGVTDVNGDPGLGGVDAFGHPLAFTDQYLAYLAGDSRKVVDKGVGIENVRSCDFLKPIAVKIPDGGNVALYSFNYFNSAEANTIIDDPNGDQNCVNILLGRNAAYIPTTSAAAAALADPNTRRMAKATQGAFKVPTLRNIGLTAPYMHNGGMATLDQVIAFYSRGTNFDSDFKHSFLIPSSTLQADKDARSSLIAFLQSLTDERVVYEKAPFDHPELIIGNGHSGSNRSVNTGNFIAPNLATDELVVLPAVGAEGTQTPQTLFENNLAD